MYMTAVYSILHLLVDGVCALAMFGSFLLDEDGYYRILIYNFCAFALQMPLGILLDALDGWAGEGKGRPDPAFLTAAGGVLLTVAGALTHPAVLGIGNALFHVGGGVGCIHEDDGRGWKGRGLGVFVAPGALGLYVGTILAKQGGWGTWYGLGSAFMAALCLGAMYFGRSLGMGQTDPGNKNKEGGLQKADLRKEKPEDHAVRTDSRKRRSAGSCRDIAMLFIVCLTVVILRSYIGMAVVLPWKTGVLTGCMAVLAVAGGKVAGGFGAARYGIRRTVIASLAVAAFCYLFSAFLPMGLVAVFLFNMTMPITLYWMVRGMPGRPGFAFGLLTFGLFLGFLPGYFGLLPEAGGEMVGCAGSVLSLLLLQGIGRRRGWGHIC